MNLIFVFVYFKHLDNGVHVQSLHVRWSATGLRAGEPDPFTVNATVGFSVSSADVQGTGLWKLSMYGSPSSDGTGEQFQRVDQILSEDQQMQPYLGGTNLTFVGARGELYMTALGCDEQYRYLCFDFARGMNPSIGDFVFTTFQENDPTKITVCSDRCTDEAGKCSDCNN